MIVETVATTLEITDPDRALEHAARKGLNERRTTDTATVGLARTVFVKQVVR